MSKHQLNIFVMLLLLGFSQIARGKPAGPLVITGPAIACVGDMKSYSISPATPGSYYYWTVTAGGTLITGNPSNPATIQWMTTGAATVSVTEKTAGGVVLNTGSLNVTVYANPAPFITTDTRVACQTFDSSNPKNHEKHDYLLDDAGGCPKVCEYSYVTYYAHSTTGGTGTWLWNVIGGTIVAGTPTSPVITVHWGPAGSGNISLTETNAGGCVGTKSICINIIDRPKAAFLIQPNTGPVPFYSACLGANLVFVDLSTAGTGSAIVNWTWLFGDGTTAAIPNPSHVYSSTGTFTVDLIVANACGCVDTFQTVVKIDPLKGPDIECPKVVCENDTATYWTSATCGIYNWTVDGGIITAGLGTASITVQWNTGDASGYGYVSLDVSGCAGVCPGTTTIKVPIVQSNPFVTRSPDPLCTNEPYEFGLPLWPSTQYHWGVIGYPSFIVSGVDNNVATIKFPAPGTYMVHGWYKNSLTYCGGDVKFKVTVMDPPTISGDLTACADATTTHPYIMSPGYSGDWTLTGPGGYTLTGTGLATFNGIFPYAGNYTLSVSGSSFCPPLPITIVVQDIPPAPNTIGGPSQVCFGTPYTYNVTSPLAGTVFIWSVVPSGAATLSTTSGSEVTAVWSAPGVISVVRQSVADPHCPSTALSIPVSQFPINPAITGPLTVCANSTMPYTDNYFIADVTTWEILPNTLGSVASGHYNPNMTVLWNNVTVPTNATIKVTVQKCGITVTSTINVLVNPAPVVTISSSVPMPICSGTTVTLTATGGAASYFWDFGDGTTATTTTSYAVHTYNSPHTSTSTLSFVASVTVSGSTVTCPPTGMGTIPISVIPGPYASISPIDPTIWCLPTIPTVNFASVVTNNIGTPTYTWYNGASPIGSGTTIMVNSAGNYHLTITDGSGCSYTSNIVPVTQISCSGGPGCTGPAITMTYTVGPCGHITATVNAPGSIGLNWSATAGYTSFMPTSSGTTYTLNLDYNVPGYYNVFAEAIYPTGCANTYQNIPVPLITHYRYDWDCSTNPYTLNLHDYSDVLAGYSISSYAWTVSGVGGGSAGTANCSFTPAAGTHTINYTVMVGTVSCTVTNTINAVAVTTVNFTPSTTSTCEGIPVNFTMSVSGGAAGSWVWNYGDGSTNSNLPTTTRNFSYSTTSPPSVNYPVNLSGVNVIGCPFSVTHPITIWHNNVSGKVSPDPYVACGGSVLLSYTADPGTVSPSTYLWSNGPSTATDNVSITGGYYVTVWDIHSCRSVTKPNKIAILNSTPPTIYGDNTYCVGETVKLGGYMGSGYTYQWYKGLVPAPIPGATTYNLVQSGLTAGTYYYQLKVVTPVFMGITCTLSSAVYTVTVNNLPSPPVISGPSVVSCPLYILKLSATGAPGTFNWSSGSPAYGPTDLVYHGGAVRCWLTDVNGCVSHADVVVPNSPDSYRDWFPQGCYDYCRNVLGAGGIQVYGPPGTFVLWNWMMGYSPILSGTNSVITPLTLTGPGNYELNLGNGLCTATFAEMEVSVKDCQCKPVIKTVDIICDPDPGHPHGYIVTVYLNNPDPINPLTVTLGMNIGPLVPFTVTVPPLTFGMPFTFNFTTLAVPPPSSATVWAHFYTPQGDCWDNFKVNLPACTWVPEKHAGNGNDEENVVPQVVTGMLVYPNPAQTAVTVNYIYGKESTADRRIKIYDALGRKIADMQVTDAAGSVTIPLNSVAAGTYLVRMEESGQTVHLQHLSVTH